MSSSLSDCESIEDGTAIHLADPSIGVVSTQKRFTAFCARRRGNGRLLHLAILTFNGFTLT
jgi:hypothetical protein